MPDPPVPISQPPTTEFLYNWLAEVTASAAVGANPTAQVSGAAVNGVATTYMRSDAAPRLADTAVTAGSYTYGSFTVDAQGRLTAAASGAAPPAAAITQLTGDVTAGPGSGSQAATLAAKFGLYSSAIVVLADAVALTTATPANVTSLVLGAGDWDVWGEVWFAEDAGTIATEENAAVNQISATLPTAPADDAGLSRRSGTGATGTGSILPVGPARVSGPTTVYLVAQATFTVSTNAAYGKLRAREVR